MQFSDYFKSGTTRAVGGKGLVLREFTCGGISTYIVSSTASSLGEKATVELADLNRQIIELTREFETRWLQR